MANVLRKYSPRLTRRPTQLTAHLGAWAASAGTAILATGLVMAPLAHAQELELSGDIAGEVRYFPDDPMFPGQFDDFQPSLIFQGEARWETEDRKHQIVFKPFFRLDGQDDERTHFDVREGYYRFNSDQNWSLTIGAAKVFWGRTESRHLVDIINQADAVEDIDEEDKLGQPMVNLTIIKDFGTIDLFVLPGFRTRTFPGVEGRLRFDPVVDTDTPLFERDAGRAGVDFAARYGHYIGNWDFGVSIFHGTSREARFAFSAPSLAGTPIDPANFVFDPAALPDDAVIRPVYDRITQGSIDLQYTKDAWLWKLEALVREGQGDVFAAAVGGFEYTLYQIFGSGADLGLLAEYQYDGRDTDIVADQFGIGLAAPVTVADNDIFSGARLALNDTQDTSLLIGGVVDTTDATTSMFMEASRRFGQNWTGEIEARLFFNVDPTNFVDAFRNDDFLTLRITRYF
ncbi:MAG: hypothetical protein AAGH42_11400 [Pseudomonadota bacterium]